MTALVKKKNEQGVWLENVPEPKIGINDDNFIILGCQAVSDAGDNKTLTDASLATTNGPDLGIILFKITHLRYQYQVYGFRLNISWSCFTRKTDDNSLLKENHYIFSYI